MFDKLMVLLTALFLLGCQEDAGNSPVDSDTPDPQMDAGVPVCADSGNDVDATIDADALAQDAGVDASDIGADLGPDAKGESESESESESEIPDAGVDVEIPDAGADAEMPDAGTSDVYVAFCGNGVLDDGEDCELEDSRECASPVCGVTGLQTCGSDCHWTAGCAYIIGSPCDDSNLCTDRDQCGVDGVCRGNTVATVDGCWSPVSMTGAPSARADHTAVWTGTEMLIWGGQGSDSIKGDGGRYNPVTDTWMPISDVGAPSARYEHVAVWTGSKMVVWGGRGVLLTDLFTTGGIYDPATDTWTPISQVNVPEGRTDFSVVWTGSEMIVWGGLGSSSYLNTGGRYNPTTNTWTETSLEGVPSGRGYHGAVWTGLQMIIWGGFNNYRDEDTGGQYIPASDLWVSTPLVGVPVARYNFWRVWTSSKMIIWGGMSGEGINSGGVLDVHASVWQSISTGGAPAGRKPGTGSACNSSVGTIWTGTEMIVWGGIADGPAFGDGNRYNPIADAWAGMATRNAPSPRYDHTAVWTGSEMIVWGGGWWGFFGDGARYSPP